jgi:uncharacterized protein (DUF4415 family)
MSDEEIVTNAAADPDNPLWTREDFRSADLIGQNGLAREPVYIRMYKVVLDHYRSFGKGYQTRINDDLLDLVQQRQARSIPRTEPVKGRRVSVSAGQRWEEVQQPGSLVLVNAT